MLMPMTRHKDDQDIALGHQIGRNIQAILRAQGLTQGQLSYKTGMPTSAISQLVNGRKNPSLLSIAKVATALDVSLDELAGLKPLQIPEPVAPETPENSELSSRMNTVESRLARIDDLERELLGMAKTQKLILEKLQGEQSARRTRKRPA